MKRLFLLVVLLVFGFVLVNRHRLYVRDPLGRVEMEGKAVAGTQVFLNFDNDVLLEDDGPPLMITLVQAGRPIGTPLGLKCLHWLACLTEADEAGLAQVETGARVETMTNKQVRFWDGRGRAVVVGLR